MKEVATDYIDTNGLYHFIMDHNQIITPDKEYIEQVLGRKFNSEETKSMDIFINKQMLNKKLDLTGADFDGDVVRYCGNDVFVTEEILRKQFLGGKEMGIRETIALIGSMSEINKTAMMALYNRLTWKGSIVHLPYMEKVTEDASDEQIKTLHKLHEYKMSEANLVIVVDADGHIGKDTQREIDWCNEHGRNIIYLSDMQVCDGESKQTKGGKK